MHVFVTMQRSCIAHTHTLCHTTACADNGEQVAEVRWARSRADVKPAPLQLLKDGSPTGADFVNSLLESEKEKRDNFLKLDCHDKVCSIGQDPLFSCVASSSSVLHTLIANSHIQWSEEFQRWMTSRECFLAQVFPTTNETLMACQPAAATLLLCLCVSVSVSVSVSLFLSHVSWFRASSTPHVHVLRLAAMRCQRCGHFAGGCMLCGTPVPYSPGSTLLGWMRIPASANPADDGGIGPVMVAWSSPLLSPGPTGLRASLWLPGASRGLPGASRGLVGVYGGWWWWWWWWDCVWLRSSWAGMRRRWTTTSAPWRWSA